MRNAQLVLLAGTTPSAAAEIRSGLVGEAKRWLLSSSGFFNAKLSRLRLAGGAPSASSFSIVETHGTEL